MALASYYLLSRSCTLEDVSSSILEMESGDGSKYEFLGDFQLVIEGSDDVILKGLTFASQTRKGPPSWYSLVRELTQNPLHDRFPTSSHSGIILVSYAERLWALSFGHSYRDVEEFNPEMRFGRIAVSNALQDIEYLRGFVSQTFGKNSKVRIESTNSDGPIDRLSFLEQSNRLRKIRAKITYDGGECIVEGGVGFRFPRPLDGNQLYQTLDWMNLWWNNGTETHSEIAERDPVREILDDVRIKQLEEEYEEALRSGSWENIFTSLDIAEMWTADSYELMLGRKNIADVAIPDSHTVMEQIRQFLDSEDERNKLRVAFSMPGGRQVRQIRRFLSYERPQKDNEDSIVVKDDGKWWEYRKSWVQSIQDEYDRFTQSCLYLQDQVPDILDRFERAQLGDKAEENWIRYQVAKRKQYTLLHQISNIKIEGSRSPVELADLHIPTSMFFHVKRGFDLKQIEAVATQAEQAARMLVQQPEYVRRAMKLCQESNIQIDFNDRRSITIGCITIAHQPRLSVRAKERVIAYSRKMHEFNFKPLWIFVDALP